jgi:hypothetical protein
MQTPNHEVSKEDRSLHKTVAINKILMKRTSSKLETCVHSGQRWREKRVYIKQKVCIQKI